jgi:NAD(P)H-quinone oxidoreductase subunit 4
MLRQVFFDTGAVPTCDVAPTCDITDVDLKTQGEQEAVCFGTSCVLPANASFNDARPREIFIALCFLVPIVLTGVYPKLATQLYDVKTVAINAQMRHAYTHSATHSTTAVSPDHPDFWRWQSLGCLERLAIG